LIDSNHHLFQPLLHQVATAVLSPGQIASPIRGILRGQKNLTVVLGEVTSVEKHRRHVLVSTEDRQGVRIEYDYLVLATGAQHSYFAHDEFERYAPGLKDLADAVAVWNKILRAFELAPNWFPKEWHYQNFLTLFQSNWMCCNFAVEPKVGVDDWKFSFSQRIDRE
jgi:NADH dehydrogenase FAD-containing subunit